MKLTQTMRESIARKEASLKFDEKIKRVNNALKKELFIQVKKQFPCSLDQKIINEGWVRTSNNTCFKIGQNIQYESMDSSYPIKPYNDRFFINPSKRIIDAVKIKKHWISIK